MLHDEKRRFRSARNTTSGLGPRGTKLLIAVSIVLVLLLSYLSAVILIEGARNPEPLPTRPQEQPADGS